MSYELFAVVELVETMSYELFAVVALVETMSYEWLESCAIDALDDELLLD